MKKSLAGIALVFIFLAIIAAVYIYFEMNQPLNGGAFLPPYALALLVAGLPWTAFMSTVLDGIIGISLGICLNITALYFIGFGIENMYRKFRK